MMVKVEWMDGVSREYAQVKTVDANSSPHAIYLYGERPAYNMDPPLIAAVPLANVRAYSVER